MVINREYFPLAEAAKVIGCIEADLIHLGATGRLKVYGLFPESVRGTRTRNNSGSDRAEIPKKCSGMGPFILDTEYLKSIEAGNIGECWVVWKEIDGGLYSFDLDSLIEFTSGNKSTRTILGCKHPPKLVVMAGDINRLLSEVRSLDPLANADANERGDKSEYSTPLLAILNLAVVEFFEPRHNVDAKKDAVVDWIKGKMIEAGMMDSENIAAAIFTIIKPENHDPRKRRG